MLPLLRASHLQPTLAVTAIATALAVSAGRGTGAVWVALAVLAGQLSVGWSNDYLDRDRDRLAGRRDKPIPAGDVSAGLVGRSAVLAAVACVPLSLLSGWRAGGVHVAAVAVAWAYNRWLKATAASVVAYAVAFGALPAFVTLGLPGRPLPPAWSVVAAGLLGAGAHFVNTLPDRADDLRAGVRALPHRFTPTGSLLIGALSMGAATAVLAVAPPGRPAAASAVLLAGAGVAVLAVVVVAVAGHERAAWTLTLCTAALSVAALLANGTSLTT